MNEENHNEKGENSAPKNRDSNRSGAQRRRVVPQARGYPPPPPGYPYGGYPPPPPGYRPPPGYPPPPPPGYPHGYPPPPYPGQGEYEYEEIEYVEDGDDTEEVVEEEVLEDEEGPSGEVVQTPPPGVYPPPQYMPSPHGRDLVEGDDSIKSMQKEGLAKAAEMEKAEEATRRRSFVFKIVFSLLFAGILFFAAFVVFKTLYNDNASIHENQTASVNEDAWVLVDDTANNLLKEFYRATGGIELTSKIKNKLMDGKITFADGLTESFYSIERNGQLYLRFGGRDLNRAYFFTADGKGKLLKATSYLGAYDPVAARDAAAMLDLLFFDEHLSHAAYSQSPSAPFRYMGLQRVGGESFESISLRNESGVTDIYCFDMVTHLIRYRLIERDGMNIRVEFTDYKDFGRGYIFPMKRKVFIDDVFASSVVIDRLAINKDVMFPR